MKIRLSLFRAAGMCITLVWTSACCATATTSSLETSQRITLTTNATQPALTPEENERYQTLMTQGAARWYPQLHPLEVLGIYATHATERQEYAQKVAKLRTERVAREIAFQQALDVAQQQIYPTLAPIESFAATNFASSLTASDLQAGDRLLWVLEQPPSLSQLQTVLTLLAQHPLVTLEVWGSDPRLQQTLRRQWTQDPRVKQALYNRQIQWIKQPPSTLSAALYHQRQTHIRPFELAWEDSHK